MILELKFVESDERLDNKGNLRKRSEYRVVDRNTSEILYHVYHSVITYKEVPEDHYVRYFVATENKNSYLPDISYYDKVFSGKNEFKIQTTSYGSLSLDKYPLFMECMEYGYAAAQLLTKVFIEEDNLA